MSGLEWAFGLSLFAIYITCLFTVCVYTFRKGYTVLGIIGIFFPGLWLIGAILPAKKGSRFDVEEERRYRSH